MSLHPSIIEHVPKDTARIAPAAFSKGNLYLSMRVVLGTVEVLFDLQRSS